MGMLQSWMRRVPDGMEPQAFVSSIERNLPQFAEGADGWKVELVKPERFAECWLDQENLKRTPDVEAKYLALAQQGQVVFVEVDW